MRPVSGEVNPRGDWPAGRGGVAAGRRCFECTPDKHLGRENASVCRCCLAQSHYSAPVKYAPLAAASPFSLAHGIKFTTYAT
nr:unnamed protein product [Digitaria exilis]